MKLYQVREVCTGKPCIFLGRLQRCNEGKILTAAMRRCLEKVLDEKNDAEDAKYFFKRAREEPKEGKSGL
jgi:hypothetical protein